MDEIFVRTWTLPEWLTKKYFDNKDFVSVDDLIRLIEDLDSDLDLAREKLKDLEEDVESNYKFISQAEQIGYDENW